MSKRSLKEPKKEANIAKTAKAKLVSSNDHATKALKLVIGSANLKRWNLLKSAFNCETDGCFTTKLLDLAQEHLKPDKKQELGGKKDVHKIKRRKHDKKKKPNKSQTTEDDPNKIEVGVDHGVQKTTVQKQTTECLIKVEKQDEKSKNKKITFPLAKNEGKARKEKADSRKNDIRKAPELGTQSKVKIEPKSTESDQNPINRVAIKIKLCENCGSRHLQDHCPIYYPNFVVSDLLTHSEWTKKYHTLYHSHLQANQDPEANPEANKYSFSRLSLPDFLQFTDTNSDHGFGVRTKVEIQAFTQFGPLIGKVVKEVDISEDSPMRDIWEVPTESSSIYCNTENLDASNWLRSIRPACSKEEKNIAVIAREKTLFFVNTRSIKAGEELFYWQDSIVANNKKKLEKTSCGGCNMTFAHPLYYRIHCSIFHDIRYSLTIRKYHCKICGVAVLGKENIMKHAAELHNGQGAYQCQFCKKYFLRLNYLEMHRTYGCSANPHRSRPLCDFCGRKFCQPQKLKVHIKRMHSDLADVLKEFQCKICLKILGSRAALQRHLKEVHQKQLDGACSCSRCGKHFQNKSNLKIHMLTHSGIKPFKCMIKSCSAAFTTKQCLQFHYKKVHNYNEDHMPKIERSVDYTFEAYSGDGDELDMNEEGNEMVEEEEEEEEDAEMDEENENSLDSRIGDPIIDSPLPPQSPPPTPEPFSLTTLKILSKGSKKWIGDSLQINKSELYPQTDPPLKTPPPIVDYAPKIDFNRHEASNASLLVEAALDSVCSEPIDIDVSTTPNTINLYHLAPNDPLPDVTYTENLSLSDQRDINLISPSVNDHISVTDELNDQQGIGMDYSNFQQVEQDFSPANSPDLHQHRSSFVRNYINTLSPQNYPQKSPSPPRYDFGHSNVEHLSSDDSNNAISAQNLSVNKNDIQLDLSIYRRDNEIDSNIGHIEGIGIELAKEKDDRKYSNIDAELVSSNDLRAKFDLDLDLRLKSYEVEGDLRGRLYETPELDFRNKNYDLIDSIDNRIDRLDSSEFRERNFEPLVLNSELQGLDMSARSFHSYSNSINRYTHHLYSEDLRLSYSPPPAPPGYTHADILRVVSLDLTPPGRHSVDLSLRAHPLHQMGVGHRLLGPDLSGRLLSEHTNRMLSGGEQLGLLEERGLMGERILPAAAAGGSVSPAPAFGAYAVAPGPYHPTPLAPPRPPPSPSSAPYHHYGSYY